MKWPFILPKAREVFKPKITLFKKITTVLRNSWFITSIRLVIILAVVEASLIGLLYKHIPFQVPLFFSRPWGEEQLVPKIYLFSLPAGLIILTIVNVCVSALVYEKENLLAYLLVFSVTLVALLVSITLFQILFLVVI